MKSRGNHRRGKTPAVHRERISNKRAQAGLLPNAENSQQAAGLRQLSVRRVWIPTALIILIGCLMAGLVLLRNRPQPVWVVSTELAEPWRALLVETGDGPDWPVIELGLEQTGVVASRANYGFAVSAHPVAVSAQTRSGDETVERVSVHPHLSRSASVDGTLALALDPWLVFRRHTTTPLTYERVGGSEHSGALERGDALLLPGRDRSAVNAWVAQLLQGQPGRFADDPERWNEIRSAIATRGGFQRGALTYDWEDIWPRLFAAEPAWVYAPLSRVQELPGHRTSALEADRFPIPDHWNEYGLQARILWAEPFGAERGLFVARRQRELSRADEWLRRADVQALIAAQLKWVPAHRQSRPATPLAAAAHRAWIGSSYVWEHVPRETNN